MLIGAGGHAKTIVDTIEQQANFHIAGFVDTIEKQKETYRAYNVIGEDKDLERIYANGIPNAFICIGYMGKSRVRNELYAKLKRIGYHLPAIIDNSAILATDVRVGEGTYIGRRTVVNAAAVIGKMCILNTGSIVEHDCIVGDFAHIAVGAVVCGGAMIRDHVFIGANATLFQGIRVEENSVIGAGSLIRKNVDKNKTVYGQWV